jgi:hypothetical protein
MSEKHQGYTNYNTFVVHMELHNDGDTYNYWRERAQECKEAAANPEETLPANYLLADLLKESIQDNSPLADTATVYTSLLDAAISEVNWLELAQEFFDEEN